MWCYQGYRKEWLIWFTWAHNLEVYAWLKGCPNECEPTEVNRAHPNPTESNLSRIYMNGKNS